MALIIKIDSLTTHSLVLIEILESLNVHVNVKKNTKQTNTANTCVISKILVVGLNNFFSVNI